MVWGTQIFIYLLWSFVIMDLIRPIVKTFMYTEGRLIYVVCLLTFHFLSVAFWGPGGIISNK